MKQLISVILIFLFLIIFTGYGGYNIATEIPITKTIYSYKLANNETINVVINKLEGTNYTIEGIDKPFNQTINTQEFIKNSEPIGELPIEILFNKIISVVFFIVSIGSLILLIGLLREYQINKKLVKILELKQ